MISLSAVIHYEKEGIETELKYSNCLTRDDKFLPLCFFFVNSILLLCTLPLLKSETKVRFISFTYLDNFIEFDKILLALS